ncbi:junctional adhesion molecule A [Alligator mississippiensis]|uniref:junctional adhesion molecule A n=1 Tax=Alligator mississippiensis TaxID=8496 RepID=UPI00287759CA|nr:junctional adhesion molecule A [Alligator mississippiensis]
MAGRACGRMLLLLLFGCWSLVAGQVTQREVPENGPVDLPCGAYLAQRGNPRIEWKFEKGNTVTLFYWNSQFTEPYKGRVQFTPSSIHFSSVTRKDTGKYICEVLGESGQLSKSEVNLIVQVAPSKPVASVPASVTIGNKAELTCKESDGSPPPTFQWYRNNIQMPVNPKMSEAFKNSSYELNPKTGQLTFDPVTGFDSGDYYCEAQNNIGTPQKSDTYRLEASELNVGAIVATVVVLLILLGLIAFGIWFAYSRGYFNSDSTNKKVIYSQPSQRSDGEFKQTSSFLV